MAGSPTANARAVKSMAERLGLEVEQEGSAMSPSIYLTIYGPDYDGDPDDQIEVRLSNHEQSRRHYRPIDFEFGSWGPVYSSPWGDRDLIKALARMSPRSVDADELVREEVARHEKRSEAAKKAAATRSLNKSNFESDMASRIAESIERKLVASGSRITPQTISEAMYEFNRNMDKSMRRDLDKRGSATWIRVMRNVKRAVSAAIRKNADVDKSPSLMTERVVKSTNAPTMNQKPRKPRVKAPMRIDPHWGVDESVGPAESHRYVKDAVKALKQRFPSLANTRRDDPVRSQAAAFLEANYPQITKQAMIIGEASNALAQEAARRRRSPPDPATMTQSQLDRVVPR